jgi:hypothetical protein
MTDAFGGEGVDLGVERGGEGLEVLGDSNALRGSGLGWKTVVTAQLLGGGEDLLGVLDDSGVSAAGLQPGGGERLGEPVEVLDSEGLHLVDAHGGDRCERAVAVGFKGLAECVELDADRGHRKERLLALGN